eukprot:scaffold35779_cov69-Phaeocystis_antarctica.AAC.2
MYSTHAHGAHQQRALMRGHRRHRSRRTGRATPVGVVGVRVGVVLICRRIAASRHRAAERHAARIVLRVVVAILLRVVVRHARVRAHRARRACTHRAHCAHRARHAHRSRRAQHGRRPHRARGHKASETRGLSLVLLSHSRGLGPKRAILGRDVWTKAGAHRARRGCFVV